MAAVRGIGAATACRLAADGFASRVGAADHPQWTVGHCHASGRALPVHPFAAPAGATVHGKMNVVRD